MADERARRAARGRAGRPTAIARESEYSDCGAYRYVLRCTWADGPAICVFICLNPTVDTSGRGPTISRAVALAQAWGYDALHLVNLYALRTNDPRELLTAPDAVGPDNDRVLLRECSRAALVVAAWGAFAAADERLRSETVQRVLDAGHVVLGRTKHGYPRHPLLVATTTMPIGGRLHAPMRLPVDALAPRRAAASASSSDAPRADPSSAWADRAGCSSARLPQASPGDRG